MALGQGSAFDHCGFSRNGVEVRGQVAITWSVLEKQSHGGTGNRQADPLLARPYYKLQPGSPCIDTGSAAATLPATDYEGDPRVVAGPRGKYPDIGADEYVPQGCAHAYGVPGFLGALSSRVVRSY